MVKLGRNKEGMDMKKNQRLTSRVRLFRSVFLALLAFIGMNIFAMSTVAFANDSISMNEAEASEGTTLDPLKALRISKELWRTSNADERAQLVSDRVEAGNRLDLYSALILIRRDIPTLRMRAEAEPFLRLLPRFHDLAIERDLGTIGPKMFEETAEALTTHMLRPAWLLLEKDDRETVLLFHRWAKNEVAESYVQDLVHLLGLDERLRRDFDFNDAETKLFAENTEVLISWAAKNRPASLMRVYQQLASIFAKIQLEEFKDLSNSERGYWVRKLRDENAISNLLTMLKFTISEATTENSSQLGDIGWILLQLHSHIEQLSTGTTPAGDRAYVPEYLRREAVSSKIVDLLRRSIHIEYLFENSIFFELLSVLEVNGLEVFAGRIREFLRRGDGTEDYLRGFIPQIRELIEELESRGMIELREDLQRRLDVAAAAIQAKVDDLEGVYLVTAENGKEYRFVIAQSARNELIAGLGAKDYGSVIRFGFSNVTYDGQKDVYTGSSEEAYEDEDRNFWVQFKSRQGRVSGQFYIPLEGFQKFQGRRIERFNNYFRHENAGADDVYGRYQGYLTCGSSKPLFLELAILKFPNRRMYGQMFLSSKYDGEWKQIASIDFPNGLFDKKTGIVYVTGRPSNSNLKSWLQVRGAVRDNKLYGQYIMGSFGLQCSNFVLDRVERIGDL